MGQNKHNLVSTDRYSSAPRLHPKDKATQMLYYDIYENYVMMNLTERQIADKYDYHTSHVSEIIKWVVFDIGEFDPDTQVQAMIDKQRYRQQEIDLLITKTHSDKVKASLYPELRRIDIFIAKLEGLLTDAFIDLRDQSKPVTVILNKEIKRREGIENEEDRQKYEDIEFRTEEDSGSEGDNRASFE